MGHLTALRESREKKPSAGMPTGHIAYQKLVGSQHTPIPGTLRVCLHRQSASLQTALS